MASAAAVLSGEADAEKIAGSIVLVGVTAAGLQDIRVTPLGEAMPGVSIHAQVISQIMTAQFLNRPAWVDGAEVLAIAALSLLLVGPLAGLAAAAGVMALIAGFCWYLFSELGLLVDPVAPIGGALLTVFATTAFWYIVIERQRVYIRQAFGRYVSPTLLARIEQSPEALRLGGVNREITVLFMDIRGFTTLSEQLSPQDTIRFLNTVHGALSLPVVEPRSTWANTPPRPPRRRCACGRRWRASTRRVRSACLKASRSGSASVSTPGWPASAMSAPRAASTIRRWATR